MPEHPESFPVNALVPIPGTPLEDNEASGTRHGRKICAYENSYVAARAVPDHSPDDLYRPYRIAGDDNTSGGWKTDAGRDATGHVFHGWRQCGIHGGADVDHAL